MVLPAQHRLGPLPHVMGKLTRKYSLSESILPFILPRLSRFFSASCLLFASAYGAMAHPLSTQLSSQRPAIASPHAPLTQTGLASWYGGSKFSGKRTANGETFHPGELTAAHRTLPLGTRILVHSPKTGRSVIVRVNDRGPFTKNRILDLSKEAATRLHIVHRGISRITLTVLPQQDIHLSQSHTHRPTQHG